MNCEDILMNFVISNSSNKPPIKVTPRKKFKCIDCEEGLSSSTKSHLLARSDCINTFYKTFNRMPLRAINFRMDPVLYKEDMDLTRQKFPNIGKL